jgi:hypothetical protein
MSICGIAAAGQTGAVSVESHHTDGAFDRDAWQAEQQTQLARLVADQVEEGLSAPVTIALTEQELRTIELGREVGSQSAPSALLAGIVKPVALRFDPASPSHGALGRSADGGLVWTAAIRSEFAEGLRVHFENVSLPSGYELWIYTMNGVVRGPYTGTGPNATGDFWSHTVGGSDAVLQLHGPAAEALDVVASFDVTEIGHVGRNDHLKAFCTFNADCVENGECYDNVSAVNGPKAAIAHMQYVKRPYIYFCSGGLLNDSGSTETPYFLTANHCISRDREAATLEAFFQFTIECGSDACPSYNQINAPSTTGASVLATNSTSDFTLLLLDEAAPEGSTFMGWTTTAVAYANETNLYRISHPGGAPQAYSQHDVWDPPVVCNGWPRGEWIYTQDKVGATEGGSSGSPVVNAQGQVVGQLSGACGTNVNDNCDNIRNSTVDGAFAAYYDQVAPWLGAGTSCQDADGDGYNDAQCGGSDCDDGDPDVNPGVDEICGDGIDNNCDGSVDEGCTGCEDADGDGYADASCGGTDCNDSDFYVNPGVFEVCDDLIDNNCDGNIDEGCTGTCTPSGEYCTSNAECCSGRCHPAKNFCR